MPSKPGTINRSGKPLLRTYRLAVLAPGHEAVVHRLAQRYARRAFHFLRPLRHDPRPAALHARFLQQRREQHAGPLAAARHPVRLRHRISCARGAVADALEKVHAGDRREALQFVHREDQRTVHHSVDHQPMFLGIDLWNIEAAVGRHVVERGRRDAADRLPQRRHDVKRQPEGIGRRSAVGRFAQRGHETGAFAIGDQLLDSFFSGLRRGRRCRGRCRRLRARGPYGCRSRTGHRGATRQELPSTRLFRIHGPPSARHLIYLCSRSVSRDLSRDPIADAAM